MNKLSNFVSDGVYMNMWQTNFFRVLYSCVFQGVCLFVIIHIAIKKQIRVYRNFTYIFWDFISSAVLSVGEYLLIFGVVLCPVVSELNQTLFKYFNKFFLKKLLPLRFKCSSCSYCQWIFCYVTIICIVNIFLTTIFL